MKVKNEEYAAVKHRLFFAVYFRRPAHCKSGQRGSARFYTTRDGKRLAGAGGNQPGQEGVGNLGSRQGKLSLPSTPSVRKSMNFNEHTKNDGDRRCKPREAAHFFSDRVEFVREVVTCNTLLPAPWSY
jgi:hypothetical protein